MNNNHISVLVVENSFNLRNKIVKTLKNEFGITNALGCSYNEDLDSLYEQQNPEIVLLSYNPENFLNVGRVIDFNRKFPETNTFALLNDAENSYHSIVKHLGFRSFITKIKFIDEIAIVFRILNIMKHSN